MAFAKYLREKQDASVALYLAHREAVLDMQEVLRRSITGEIALDSQPVKEWIHDEKSIFRMLKKHDFNIVNAQVASRQTLHWRVSVLAPFLQDLTTMGSPSCVECLPPDVQDVDGRPVLLVKLSRLPDSPDKTKLAVLRAYEVMRARLAESGTVVQCVMIVDFQGANLRSMSLELLSWFIREVAPRFPGMCAAVLIVNYSWAYSGAYNVGKRVLPAAVLERITFPTQAELLTHFERRRLPREYGGDLNLFPRAKAPTPPKTPQPRRGPARNTDLTAYLPSMSLLNPFYGYPAVTTPDSSTAQLKNGRRRKRDLARTLVLLWLAKLKRMADKTWLWIVLTVILWLAGFQR